MDEHGWRTSLPVQGKTLQGVRAPVMIGQYELRLGTGVGIRIGSTGRSVWLAIASAAQLALRIRSARTSGEGGAVPGVVGNGEVIPVIVSTTREQVALKAGKYADWVRLDDDQTDTLLDNLRTVIDEALSNDGKTQPLPSPGEKRGPATGFSPSRRRPA